MKKAKVVVNQAAKKNRLTFGKKAALASLGLVATLGVVSVVVPTSNIPGFSYIAQAIGLNVDATRNLTMADFASYAIGTKDNKIQELRASNLSYNGSGNYGGGLSPFATLTSDRLAEAYEKNAKEAMEMEKRLGGKIKPFNKNNVNREIVFDKNMLAKGFDPARLSGSSQAARSGAMEALAAAAGLQAEAFGKPLKKDDLQDIASILNLKDSNISNIVGGGNIASLASKEDSTYEKVMQAARALSGTSVFGVSNPELNRTDTKIGRPVYGLFKDLGNSYFFSRYATGAKLPTAASDIAVAAFDGGSPQDQSLVTDEDAVIMGSSTNPMLSLNSSAQSVQKCSELKETYKQSIATYLARVQAQLEYMYQLKHIKGVDPVKTDIPGLCKGDTNKNKPTKFAREDWNREVDNLSDFCEQVRRDRKKFATQCGITFEEPIKSCSEMARSLKLAVSKNGVMFRKCRNVSVFGTDGEVRINNVKRKKWNKAKKECKNEHPDWSEEELIDCADSKVPIMPSDIEGSFNICDNSQGSYNQEFCKDYISARLEEGFAFGKIIDITSLPKK